MITKRAARKIETLIRFMERLPRSANKHFDMSQWFSHDEPDHHDLKRGKTITKRELTLCGTTACALGWACQIPSFRRAGLKLVYSPLWSQVQYKTSDSTSVEAGAEFFGIGYHQASALFIDCDASTPKQWARMARKKLAQWAR